MNHPNTGDIEKLVFVQKLALRKWDRPTLYVVCATQLGYDEYCLNLLNEGEKGKCERCKVLELKYNY